MITKTMTALSAILVLGSVSAASASELNDPMLNGRDVIQYQTHLQGQDRAPVIATAFSAVRRSAAEKAFDRITDSTE